jgi:membrane-associated phospholipid phosphatase
MATISPFRRAAEGLGGWGASSLGVAHLAFLVATSRLRWEHVLADGLLVALPWMGARWRAFALAALPFWLVGTAFDAQPLWLWLRGPIHVADLYAWEVHLFPAFVNGARGTWAELFTAHPLAVLDVAAGLAYATYLAEVFGVALALYFKARAQFQPLAWAFLIANVIGLVTYVVFPAAPPWYVMEHGLGPADVTVLPSAAGAARFDALFGISYFASFYSRNPNVFGAMPSLHAAYPLLVFLHTWALGRAWRVATGAYAALVAFSAVYLAHHYVLDVLVGGLVAVTASAVASFALRRRPHHLTFSKEDRRDRVSSPLALR